VQKPFLLSLQYLIRVKTLTFENPLVFSLIVSTYFFTLKHHSIRETCQKTHLVKNLFIAGCELGGGGVTDVCDTKEKVAKIHFICLI
jgi:hypothetical protein